MTSYVLRESSYMSQPQLHMHACMHATHAKQGRYKLANVTNELCTDPLSRYSINRTVITRLRY